MLKKLLILVFFLCVSVITNVHPASSKIYREPDWSHSVTVKMQGPLEPEPPPSSDPVLPRKPKEKSKPEDEPKPEDKSEKKP